MWQAMVQAAVQKQETDEPWNGILQWAQEGEAGVVLLTCRTALQEGASQAYPDQIQRFYELVLTCIVKVLGERSSEVAYRDVAETLERLVDFFEHLGSMTVLKGQVVDAIALCVDNSREEIEAAAQGASYSELHALKPASKFTVQRYGPEDHCVPQRVRALLRISKVFGKEFITREG